MFLAQSFVQPANFQRFRPPFRDAENDKNSPDSTTDDRDDWANNAAVKPDSSAPNSFEVPIKMLFTAETRPRISSGVTSCTMVPRMITLTPSNAPIKNSIARQNQNTRDTPKRMAPIPKPVKHQSKVTSARL